MFVGPLSLDVVANVHDQITQSPGLFMERYSMILDCLEESMVHEYVAPVERAANILVLRYETPITFEVYNDICRQLGVLYCASYGIDLEGGGARDVYGTLNNYFGGHWSGPVRNLEVKGERYIIEILRNHYRNKRIEEVIRTLLIELLPGLLPHLAGVVDNLVQQILHDVQDSMGWR